ncbi:hypothetical protein HK102_006641, partial [Quaeritorhiza haematococci]
KRRVVVTAGAFGRGGVLRVREFGSVMPDVSIAIVDPDTNLLLPPYNIGEVWVAAGPSQILPSGFWGLPKLSEQTFRAKPVAMSPGAPSGFILDQEFVRTGLFGFVLDGALAVPLPAPSQTIMPGLSDTSSTGDLAIDRPVQMALAGRTVNPRLFVLGIKRDRVFQRKANVQEAVLARSLFAQLASASLSLYAGTAGAGSGFAVDDQQQAGLPQGNPLPHGQHPQAYSDQQQQQGYGYSGQQGYANGYGYGYGTSMGPPPSAGLWETPSPSTALMMLMDGVGNDGAAGRAIGGNSGIPTTNDSSAVGMMGVSDFSVFWASDLIEGVMSRVAGIDCCALFALHLNGDILPVLMLESSLPKTELDPLCKEIKASLRSTHSFRLYCVVTCAPGSLPRLKPTIKGEAAVGNNINNNNEGGTELQAEFYGYTCGVVSVPSTAAQMATGTGAGGPAGHMKKLVTLDVELCKHLFKAGDVPGLTHVSISAGTDVVVAALDSLPGGPGEKKEEGIPPSAVNAADGGSPTKTTQQVGQIVGGLVDVPILDDKNPDVDLSTFPTISHLLIWRASLPTTDKKGSAAAAEGGGGGGSSSVAFALVDYKGRETKTMTFAKFSQRVQSTAHHLIIKRGIQRGETVILLFTHGIEYMIALHACLYAGIIAIPLPPPDPNRIKEDVPALMSLIDEFGVRNILVNAAAEENLKGKIVQAVIRAVLRQKAAAAGADISLKSKIDVSAQFPNVINLSRVPKLGKMMSTDDPIFWLSKSQLGQQQQMQQAEKFGPALSHKSSAVSLQSQMSMSSSTSSSAVSGVSTIAGGRLGGFSGAASDVSSLSQKQQMIQQTQEQAAIILVHFSPDMRPTFVRCSHSTLMDQSKLQAIHAQLLHSTAPTFTSPDHPQKHQHPKCRPLVSCVRAYSDLGLLFSAFVGIYVGAPTILVPPFEFFMSPQVWFDVIHKYKVKDAFTTYPMLEHAMAVMSTVDYRTFSLHGLKNMIVTTEGRTRPDVYATIREKFLLNRLDPLSIATTYSPEVNPMVSSRGYMNVPVTNLWLDLKALRRGKVVVARE